VKIRQVAVTVDRLDQAANFYRDVLQLPIHAQAEQVTVTVGSSRLILEAGDHFDGVHHVAFGIAPADFEFTRGWLGQRVDPILVDGSEVIEGPEGWHSKSVYFLGPEDILLEFIARDADDHASASEADAPQPLSISEVGIGVPDVAGAVATLTEQLGLPAFPRRARTSPRSVATTVWSSWSTRSASGSPPPPTRQHEAPWTWRSKVCDQPASR